METASPTAASEAGAVVVLDPSQEDKLSIDPRAHLKPGAES